MATLLLRLAAPLQSWGMDSKFETRKTNREPTKSGVVGLLAAALGIGREEPEKLIPLNQLRFGVRVDQEGDFLVDYHVARKEEKTRKAEKITPYITYRHYLTDAIFLAGLESQDDAFLQELAQALRHPAFPLFLGRRSCPPTMPLCLGIRQKNLKTALAEEPLLIPAWRQPGPAVGRMVLDAAPGEPGAVPQRDLPLSFSQTHRQFGYRLVREDKAAGLLSTEHDAFAEL